MQGYYILRFVTEYAKVGTNARVFTLKKLVQTSCVNLYLQASSRFTPPKLVKKFKYYNTKTEIKLADYKNSMRKASSNFKCDFKDSVVHLC